MWTSTVWINLVCVNFHAGASCCTSSHGNEISSRLIRSYLCLNFCLHGSGNREAVRMRKEAHPAERVNWSWVAHSTPYDVKVRRHERENVDLWCFDFSSKTENHVNLGKVHNTGISPLGACISSEQFMFLFIYNCFILLQGSIFRCFD